jgi:hypothetical protein
MKFLLPVLFQQLHGRAGDAESRKQLTWLQRSPQAPHRSLEHCKSPSLPHRGFCDSEFCSQGVNVSAAARTVGGGGGHSSVERRLLTGFYGKCFRAQASFAALSCSGELRRLGCQQCVQPPPVHGGDCLPRGSGSALHGGSEPQRSRLLRGRCLRGVQLSRLSSDPRLVSTEAALDRCDRAQSFACRGKCRDERVCKAASLHHNLLQGGGQELQLSMHRHQLPVLNRCRFREATCKSIGLG